MTVDEVLKDVDCTYEVDEDKKLVTITGTVSHFIIGEVGRAGYKVTVIGAASGVHEKKDNDKSDSDAVKDYMEENGIVNEEIEKLKN